LLLSAISPWEFSKLLEKGRLGISCDPEKWIIAALDIPKLRLVHLSPMIAYRSTILPKPFQGDPADQIIVATAREENATILSKDKNIQTYEYVQTLW
jgi:PIN domain nuclease of toxin-antitoxin system